jgi:acyl-CoA synthetase (AMP-forming)/AMP-acid ligase II
MTHEDRRSLQFLIRDRLEKDPEGRAFTFYDSAGAFSWRSFSEFHASGARCGSILAESGLSRGEVCVILSSSDELTANILFGCLLIGALPLLVAPPVVRGLHSNLAQVLEHVIRKTSARMVVLEDEHRQLGEVVGSDIERIKILYTSEFLDRGDPAAAPLAFPVANDIAALQLTSGTTGFPRVCVWDQNAVLQSLDGMERAMDLSASDVCVNWTPLYHDMGLVNNFMLCLMKGVPLVMLGTMDFLKKPALWLQALSVTGASVTWSPNFGYAFTMQRVREHDLAEVRLDRVRSFWNAAERIHLDTMLAFQEKFASYGVSLDAMKTNFGCAENVGGATFSDARGRFVVEHVDKHRLYDERIASPVPDAGANSVSVVGVGRSYPGMSIEIHSADGKPLPDGHVGEIALDTPSRMRGYLGDEENTRLAIRGRFLYTGDFGYLRGEQLFWVGRVQERINLHGKKYDPSDFEAVLLQIDGLRKGCFAAFGIDDEKIGSQRLIIVSEVSDANRRPLQAIREDVREEVATSLGARVDEIMLLSQGSMTKTTSGKRRHKYYRQLYLDGELEALAIQE